MPFLRASAPRVCQKMHGRSCAFAGRPRGVLMTATLHHAFLPGTHGSGDRDVELRWRLPASTLRAGKGLLLALPSILRHRPACKRAEPELDRRTWQSHMKIRPEVVCTFLRIPHTHTAGWVAACLRTRGMTQSALPSCDLSTFRRPPIEHVSCDDSSGVAMEQRFALTASDAQYELRVCGPDGPGPGNESRFAELKHADNVAWRKAHVWAMQ